MRGAVRQEWALVGDDPRHVSEFAGLAPKDRPAGTCLECKKPVIFKCGGVRSHHVAHRAANEECEAARGEGAEHYNAKLYLASVLRQARGFEAFQHCVRCNVLNGSQRLAFTYDRVELEHSHPNRLRADLALFSGGELACVIEIYVSHRCEYEKIAYHEGAGIPCLELSAEYAQKWAPPKPLSPTAVHGIDRWMCSTCRERAESFPALGTLGHAAPPLELEPPLPPPPAREEAGKVKRNVTALQKIFFTDPPDDLPFKQTFVTIEYIEYERGGQVQLKRLFVWDSGEIIGTLYEAYPPYDEQKDEAFRKAYRGYVEELRDSYGPIRRGRWMTFPENAGSLSGRKTPAIT